MSPLPPLADIRAAHTPAVVILGNDAQLAARPATPVQLAHACLAAGFRVVVPASWGDELVAGATLDALSGLASRPAIHCACPHVARRVLAVGAELAPHLVSLVAPAVAAARYLRLHAVGDLRITYVGRCPAAADDSIDARLTPEELLAQLVDRDIDLLAQPEVFESVIPPDRRRHLSLPGGLPSPEVLRNRAGLAVETMSAEDFAAQLAQLVLGRGNALIDPAPAVGCVCSGAINAVPPADSRASIVALEPPRSSAAIVDESGTLPLGLSLPAVARDAADLIADPTPARNDTRLHTASSHALGDAPPPPPPPAPARRPRLTPPGLPAITASPASAPSPAPSEPAPRRRPSAGPPRMVPGSVPVSSDSEGRILPRAYVARRRSPKSGIPVVHDSPGRGDSVLEPTTHDAHHTRERAPRHTVPDAADTDTARVAPDRERPVVRSVELPFAAPIASGERPETADVAAAAPPPAAPRPASAAAPPVSGRTVFGALGSLRGAGLAGAAARLRERSGVMLVAAIAATGLLLGVAIGYSMAHRRAGVVAGPAEDRSGDSVLSRPEREFPGVRESVSAGGIASSPGTPRRTPARAPARGEVVTPRVRLRAPPAVAGQKAEALPASPGASPVGGAATSSASPAPNPAIARAAADSLARAESLAAERESIRREIALRRARLDSIERARLRLDSLQRLEQSGGRPPDD